MPHCLYSMLIDTDDDDHCMINILQQTLIFKKYHFETPVFVFQTTEIMHVEHSLKSNASNKTHYIIPSSIC